MPLTSTVPAVSVKLSTARGDGVFCNLAVACAAAASVAGSVVVHPLPLPASPTTAAVPGVASWSVVGRTTMPPPIAGGM